MLGTVAVAHLLEALRNRRQAAALAALDTWEAPSAGERARKAYDDETLDPFMPSTARATARVTGGRAGERRGGRGIPRRRRPCWRRSGARSRALGHCRHRARWRRSAASHKRHPPPVVLGRS